MGAIQSKRSSEFSVMFVRRKSPKTFGRLRAILKRREHTVKVVCYLSYATITFDWSESGKVVITVEPP